MKKYLSMILFVVVMGVVSVSVLIGADFLTKDLIAKNTEYIWKSAILTHHEIEHSQTNFSELFDENLNTSEATNPENNNPVFLYSNSETNRVSYRFKGNGLWDVIEGVITLEEDFQTIVAITVTKQGETPGLGGIVAEKKYLDNYIGKIFDLDKGLEIVKTPPEFDYQVDAITGATGTSNAFAGILNSNYKLMLSLFTNVDILSPLKKAILTHNNTQYNNQNYDEVFLSNINILNKDNLTLYIHKTTKNVSYQFNSNGLYGNISTVITLNEDFKTIVKITVLAQSEMNGAVIQTNEHFFDDFTGLVFNETIEIVNTTPTEDNQIDFDGFAGITSTKNGFMNGLNSNYALYFNAFGDGQIEIEDPNKIWMTAILDNNGLTYTDDNYENILNSNFDKEVKSGLALYKHKTNNTVTFLFEGEGKVGTIKSVLTLESDFITIKKVSVYEQSENWGAKIQTNPAILAEFVGSKFIDNIVMVEIPELDNEVVDGLSGVTETKDGFLNSLNQTYKNYKTAFGWGA